MEILKSDGFIGIFKLRSIRIYPIYNLKKNVSYKNPFLSKNEKKMFFLNPQLKVPRLFHTNYVLCKVLKIHKRNMLTRSS